ncbi:MAG: hypothetical protein JJ966_08615 [Balneolaceae bacterium]|nr:hypothetical protein [Balneolaceae bacterium]
MRTLIILAVSLFILTNCNDVTGSEEIKTPSEMILGKWKVSEATIDGSVYPVTNPGFGQIEVTFTENDVEYIYPGVDDSGMPTASTDTLIANWQLENESTLIHITHPINNVTLFEWEVVNLGVGLLKTSFISQSPLDQQSTSTYILTYQLIE